MTIFVFFVIAPIISIAIGTLIVQNVILPHFQDIADTKPASKIDNSINNNESNENIIKEKDDKENDVEDLNKLELTINGFNLYNIQIGSFSKIENAQALIKELREKGLGGYIVKINDYKVFCGTYLDREVCDKVLTDIRKFYTDAFVNTITVDNFTTIYDNNEQEVADTIDEIIKIFKKSFDEETSLWYYALKNNDLENIIETIKINNDQINNLLNDIKKDITNPDLVKIIDSISVQVKEREEILQSLNSNKELVQDSYNKYYKLLFDFIKLFK